MRDREGRLKEARERSWGEFGKKMTFYLPGMFYYHGLRGRYPAVSITGNDCALQCDHCRGSILTPMLAAKEPDLLVQHCRDLKEKGNLGVLISGGCDRQGRLPWDRFGEAIERIKEKTGLYISVHSGLVDYPTALRLKHAGVDQALIDVIGDEETLQRVYHVDYGVSSIVDSLEALEKAQLSVIPHIVCGLHYGIMKGESNALDLLTAFEVKQLVIVSLMNIPRTPFARIKPPATEEVMDIVLEARTKLPQTIISLGCARQRGNNLLETLAVDAGVNRMALPSEEAIQRATDHGLEIRYQRTCCSVSTDSSSESW